PSHPGGRDQRIGDLAIGLSGRNGYGARTASAVNIIVTSGGSPAVILDPAAEALGHRALPSPRGVIRDVILHAVAPVRRFAQSQASRAAASRYRRRRMVTTGEAVVTGFGSGRSYAPARPAIHYLRP